MFVLCPRPLQIHIPINLIKSQTVMQLSNQSTSQNLMNCHTTFKAVSDPEWIPVHNAVKANPHDSQVKAEWCGSAVSTCFQLPSLFVKGIKSTHLLDWWEKEAKRSQVSASQHESASKMENEDNTVSSCRFLRVEHNAHVRHAPLSARLFTRLHRISNTALSYNLCITVGQIKFSVFML